MENLIESNEKTLVMFDAVCLGLGECIALVHADIKQMTEHRNRLLQLEQDRAAQAKLRPVQGLMMNFDRPPDAARAPRQDHDKQEQQVDNLVIINDINRKTRLAMQYSKQLEANLFDVEDLRSKYEMHLKMGLVVKSVSRAYLTRTNSSSQSSTATNSPGSLLKPKRHHCSSLVMNTGATDSSSLGTRSSLSSLNLSNWSFSRSLKRNRTKSQQFSNSIYLPPEALNGAGGASGANTTIKEFIENIDRIESEFESLMGSFLVVVDEIQGFARVCQGDVFDITIRYGESQKFKTKITVLKDNKQKCHNRENVFKANIADVLAIKAYERKGLGKKLLLGHKLCETRDLFTARSQLMTISLNRTGSIKLNLIITWNPLHLAPNTRHHSLHRSTSAT